MSWLGIKKRISRLDLQAKVMLVLFLVIAPTFLLVTVLVRQFTIPVIQEELRLVGAHSANTLSDEVEEAHLLGANKSEDLERKIIQTLYLQPNIIQIDIFRRAESGEWELAGSSEDATLAVKPESAMFAEKTMTIYQSPTQGANYWEVWSPIRHKKNIVGMIRLEVSLQSAKAMERAVWKVMMIAGSANIALLLIALSYFLRKTISNDKKLRQAESYNVELSEQLHEAERQLMIQEKLAVMGQLTASFAHEIGTPLNAVGGHMDLLREEMREAPKAWHDRLQIITEQLLKIENIVKGFLQSTAKPSSQYQLLDLNQVVEKTLGIVRPRLDTLGVRLDKSLDKKLAPVRAVPLDIEQILLNLFTNSLDSIQSKQRGQKDMNAKLEVFSKHHKSGLKEWIELGVLDSGQGISRLELQNVFKPFYTTKAVGEGTGLGLTICQEIAQKYQGKVEIESKEGAWTKVTLRLPYGVNV